MKIAYLCADPGISLGRFNGSANHIRNVVRCFTALGHEVILITASADGTGDLGVQVQVIAAPVTSEALLDKYCGPEPGKGGEERRVVRALRHIWNNVAVEQVLGDVISKLRPDLIYERYSPFITAGAQMAGNAGIPHLLEVNAPLAWEGEKHRGQALPEAARVLEQSAFDTTNLIVTVSHELRDVLIADGVRGEKVKVVFNGVDTGLFAPDGPTYRNGLAGQVVIGFVGSLKPWHGIDILGEAFRTLARDPRFALLIVGDGPKADLIQSLQAELPERVKLIPSVPPDEIPNYLRAMDIAVAPYPPQEPFYFSPLKVLEYMAAGRAVVASRVGQVTELLQDGETGLLVTPGDPVALAKAVQRLADEDDLRRALGAKAAAEARQSHSWMQRASEIVDLARTVT